ncbi:sequestosome-1-like [Pomacea canaliculata]|uniref:sequestosome-1-like n=1 Tax=Pomacea canaliculata TaxID=400727 RepID=UPI000D73565C|nr:sequestosome-1-like [Pomacea canaliculata]
MALVVKAFLEKNNDVKGEIRRFQVEADSPDIYQDLVRKVGEIFALAPGSFQLFWQDSDGDFVTFSSKDELKEAVACSADGVLRLFVKPRESCGNNSQASAEQNTDEKSEREKVFHPGVVCDGCEGAIFGPRFKCVICPDYDLCSKCEQKGTHPEHDKFKITHPLTAGGPGWHENPGNKCPADGSAECSGPSTSENAQQDKSTLDDDYLKNIGEGVAAFLDPFGIDVTYEVHHEENQRGGRMGFHGKRGAQCPFKWSMFSNGSGTSGSSQSSEDQKENFPNKPAEAAGKSEEETSAPAAEEEGATGEKSAMSTSPADPQKKEGSPSSGDEDWTMLTERDTTTGERSGPRDSGLYPNLQVTQAVEMMKSMGFNDDGGWLTRLLESTGGDIVRALDTLRLGAQQASSLS